MSRGLSFRLAWLGLFAMAMAYLESAVVVYLRALFFPNGFSFPLPEMDPHIVATELGREVATLVMLFAPAALLAKKGTERFAWFLFAFGVWDIFYYAWLKVLLDWPASLMDMDILFLVPVPWVGPVIAPCLVSLGFIALAIVLLIGAERHGSFSLRLRDSLLLVGGACAILWSFVGDHVLHAFTEGADLLNAGPAYMLRDSGLEAAFSWSVFLLGITVALVALGCTVRRAFR